MKITLKRLSIINFKGIKDFSVDFKHITNIFGDNETGKTSTFDAFLWLFFGKNSEYASQFGVKRVDSNNKFIKDLEVEVSAIIQIDQQEVCVKKVLRQKWVRRRGELEAEYQGDENTYSWNSVPMKETDFKAKIKEIIDESLFRLITNPFQFNSMAWTDRRNALVSIAGNISDQEVLEAAVNTENKVQFTELVAALNSGKTLKEFKSQLAERKKKIKDEAAPIPSRIDEVRRGMPEELNFTSLRNELQDANTRLEDIKKTLSSEVLMQQQENLLRAQQMKEFNQAVQNRQQKSFGFKTRMQNIEFEVKQQAKEAGGQLDAQIVTKTRTFTDKEIDLKRYSDSITGFEKEVTDKNAFIQKCRDDYDRIEAEKLEFNDNDFVCPSCKQDLPVSNVTSKKEELTANFNNDKRERLEAITDNALKTKSEVEALSKRISAGKGVITGMEKEVNDLKSEIEYLKTQSLNAQSNTDETIQRLLAAHVEYQQLVSDLATNEALVLTEPVFDDIKTNTDLEQQGNTINARIKELEKEIGKEELIASGKARILELEQQESKLAQELAELEGSEFAMLLFSKARVELIEQRINGMFKYVTFKMFNQQNNGGETECCDTLINGVPFSDANNAARINAGIDIINAFTKHYNAYAPIFVDNRESVTRLLESDSQIVNLIVSESDKTLRVS